MIYVTPNNLKKKYADNNLQEYETQSPGGKKAKGSQEFRVSESPASSVPRAAGEEGRACADPRAAGEKGRACADPRAAGKESGERPSRQQKNKKEREKERNPNYY